MCSSLLIAGAVLHGVTALPSGGRPGERGGLGSASAQLHMGWVTNGAAREFIAGVNATDEAVEMTGWVLSPTEPFVYSCGYVTNAGGHTAMFVARYDADTGEPLPGGAKFYPDVLGGPINVTGQHKATGITVDTQTGDIYVCGESKPLGQDSLYVVQRFTFDLERGGSSPAWPNDGVVTHDHSGGDDRPEDIGVFGSASTGFGDVVVTGTTFNDTDGTTDITSIRLDVVDGTFSTFWPPSTLGVRGVRTYPDGGADSWAAEQALIQVTEEVGDGGMSLFVAGTTRPAGAGTDKDVLVYRIRNGDEFTGGALGWVKEFDGPEGGDDVATGIAADSDADGNGSIIAVCGHTAGPPASIIVPGASPNSDYLALLYEAGDGSDLWIPQGGIWQPEMQGDRSDDRAFDINIYSATSNPADLTVWLTGAAAYGTENDTEIGTVVFDALSLTGSEEPLGWNVTGDAGQDDRGVAVINGVVGGTMYIPATSSTTGGMYFATLLFGTDFAVSELRHFGTPATGRAMYRQRFDGDPAGTFMAGLARFTGSGTGYDATTVRFAD